MVALISAELRRLAREVLAQMREPQDLAAWAWRLASDVAEAND